MSSSPDWIERLRRDQVALRGLGLIPTVIVLGRQQRSWLEDEDARRQAFAGAVSLPDAADREMERLWGMPIVDAHEDDVALLLVAPNSSGVYRRDDGRQVLIHEFRIEVCPSCGQQFVP